MSVAKRRKGRPQKNAKAGSATLGGRIMEVRLAAGFADIHQLAVRSGISAELIRKIEQHGHGNPTLDTLRSLAEACGVLVADLIRE